MIPAPLYIDGSQVQAKGKARCLEKVIGQLGCDELIPLQGALGGQTTQQAMQ